MFATVFTSIVNLQSSWRAREGPAEGAPRCTLVVADMPPQLPLASWAVHQISDVCVLWLLLMCQHMSSVRTPRNFITVRGGETHALLKALRRHLLSTNSRFCGCLRGFHSINSNGRCTHALLSPIHRSLPRALSGRPSLQPRPGLLPDTVLTLPSHTAFPPIPLASPRRGPLSPSTTRPSFTSSTFKPPTCTTSPTSSSVRHSFLRPRPPWDDDREGGVVTVTSRYIITQHN